MGARVSLPEPAVAGCRVDHPEPGPADLAVEIACLKGEIPPRRSAGLPRQVTGLYQLPLSWRSHLRANLQSNGEPANRLCLLSAPADEAQAGHDFGPSL